MSLIGVPFLELLSVDSTNNYAMAMVHEGMAQHGTAVFAHEQTRGKGQRSKSWMTQKNENIIISIIVQPAGFQLTQFFSFSMAMALGAHQFFNTYADNGTKIKWPNDLYWRDRKAGGILIENIVQGEHWKYAVVGMGININQVDFGDLNKAVSLKQITGKTYDTVSMAKELCSTVDAAFNTLKNDPQQIQAAYHRHLYKMNETVKLKKASRIFTAEIKGVNPAGQLITQHATEEAFDIGAVEWVQ